MKETNKTDNNVPNKEFKTFVIRMLTELGKSNRWTQWEFSKELENIKTEWSELKNKITESKSTLEGTNGRLGDLEDISDLKDRIMETTQTKQQNIKQTSKNEESLKDHSIIGVPRRRDKGMEMYLWNCDWKLPKSKWRRK